MEINTMEKFNIIEELPSSYFIVENNISVVITKKDQTINEDTIPKPYTVFVSESLTPEILKNLFIDNRLNSGFLLAKKKLPILNDYRWTFNQMDLLNYKNLNFLRFINGEGFYIWSDNIIGAEWGGIKIKSLSLYRLLCYINSGSCLADKYHRAIFAGVIVKGSPYEGFSIRPVFQPYCFEFLE